jgi:hypothetical protein
MKIESSARGCRSTIPLRVCAIVSLSPSTIFTRDKLLCEIGLGRESSNYWRLQHCNHSRSSRWFVNTATVPVDEKPAARRSACAMGTGRGMLPAKLTRYRLSIQWKVSDQKLVNTRAFFGTYPGNRSHVGLNEFIALLTGQSRLSSGRTGIWLARKYM